jgi:hypothetical protein
MSLPIYIFSDTAVKVKPSTTTTLILEKAMNKEPLTRKEKDQIANILYGTFGSQGPIYKLHGWAWNMSSSLKRILVSRKYEPGTFYTYYAPDKTSLRKALGNDISEMIEAPERN